MHICFPIPHECEYFSSGSQTRYEMILITRRATVAGDSQVRITDIGESAVTVSGNGGETEYSLREARVCTLRCHSARTKRIVTEGSPDIFLTVAEVCLLILDSCTPILKAFRDAGRDSAPTRPARPSHLQPQRMLCHAGQSRPRT